jgi:acyl-CoA synthetase (AMP-forming)/AMP-acid ligase II
MPKFHLWGNGDLALFAFSNSEPYPNVNGFEDLFEENEALSDVGQRLFGSVTPYTLGKIQFTSGSTKLPKGVQVTHGMMISNQVGIAQMWPFWEPDEAVVDWLPWNHTFALAVTSFSTWS